MNLLDLNNDVLNIIGDYVKADNNRREFQELIKKEIFDEADKLFKRLNTSVVWGIPNSHNSPNHFPN